MRILDRHIAGRFLWNFVVLFALLFVLAVSIDVILQLDRFIEAGKGAVRRGDQSTEWIATLVAIFDFHGPRLFQFYAYLLGLVCVAAAGFTLAQMHRARELTAMLATGISLHRVAVPILCAATGLNALQIVNQELIIPRLASRLIRDHGEILGRGLQRAPLPLTADGQNNLFIANAFDPRAGTLERVVIIQRERSGTAIRRISATSARWSAAEGGWRLVDGEATGRQARPDEGAEIPFGTVERGPIDFVASDLDPQSIVIRGAAQFAQMLSLAQISRLEAVGGVDPDLLSRMRWSRFSALAANLVVLVLVLPTFLLREPANMLRQSVQAALIAIPAMLGALLGMIGGLPGIAPALAVFLPVLVLAPIAIGRAIGLRT